MTKQAVKYHFPDLPAEVSRLEGGYVVLEIVDGVAEITSPAELAVVREYGGQPVTDEPVVNVIEKKSAAEVTETESKKITARRTERQN